MAPTLLQNMVFPDSSLCDEPSLFFHCTGAAYVSNENAALTFGSEGLARSNTYFNGLSLRKWAHYCALPDLSITFEGRGQFALRILSEMNDFTQRTVKEQVLDLSDHGALTIDLSDALAEDMSGFLSYELRCLSPEGGLLSRADFTTSAQPNPDVSLALAITTFRREKEVESTVARFSKHFAEVDPALLRLIVVDNGKSAHIEESAHVKRVENDNLGGSGGFARGLIEAKTMGATHCLFMDDDASVFMSAIERTLTFLQLAKSPDVAVAGAMSHSRDSFRIWENGAQFHKICRPVGHGRDLRESTDVLKTDNKFSTHAPEDFYGGWWFFAFPISKVEHHPFPFFVRGDDVSFSLANKFDIATLNGVMSFQNEDFSEKETPLTVYLDIRSHIAHHLALPFKDIGRLGIASIIARFWLRSLLSFHYETIEAASLGAQDALSGPAHFDQNADVAERRAQIGALTRKERWKDRAELDIPAQPGARELSSKKLWVRLLMKATLNGHFLPFFASKAKPRILPAVQRSMRRSIWGAPTLAYLSADGVRAYSVSIDRKAALRATWLCAKQIWRVLWHYPRILDAWRTSYPEMTTEAYWQQKLGLGEPAQSPAPEAAK